MNTKINTFKHYRTRVNIPLSDVAHLLGMDISNLSKVEHGTRLANPHIILLYHVLFKVPLTELFAEQYNELKNLWSSRSITLIDELVAHQPPKSTNRIAYFKEFVNTLTSVEHDRT